MYKGLLYKLEDFCTNKENLLPLSPLFINEKVQGHDKMWSVIVLNKLVTALSLQITFLEEIYIGVNPTVVNS